MGPTPAGYDAASDEAARLVRVRERFQQAKEGDRRNEEAMHEDLLMLVGGDNQWPADAVAERKRTGRPLYTANRFPSMLAQITGEIRRNKPGIQCAPGDNAATPVAAKVFEGIIRAIERLSQAPHVYARVGKSAAAAGKGHMRIVPVREDDVGFDTGLRIRAIKNIYSVKWDPGAQSPDKSDANWCIVISALDKKGFEEAYGTVANAAWTTAQANMRQLDGWHSGMLGSKVTVAEEWQVKREPYERFRVAKTKPGFWVNPQTGMGEQTAPTGEDPDVARRKSQGVLTWNSTTKSTRAASAPTPSA